MSSNIMTDQKSSPPFESVHIGPATLYRGDVLDVLRTMSDDSVDSIVTDPPYELGFMGKAWDASGIAYNVDMWREALRVLKPGGHLLAFSGSRTYHRMAVAIEDAGFEIRDQIMWVYGSGFPKSLDVSKAIDKAAGAEREVVGQKTGRGATPVADLRGGPLVGDKGRIDCSAITAPATDAAHQWDGWGTALKPAHEPICVARKLFRGTVAANVLEFGTGALNIGACRVTTDDDLRGSGQPPYKMSGANARPFHKRAGEASAERVYADSGGTNFAMTPGPRGGAPEGRWPANLIHDGSQDVVALFPTQAGQQAALKTRNSDKTRNTFGEFAGTADANFQPHDERGSAARFFYCAKASRKDRNEGLGDPGPQLKRGTTLRNVEDAAAGGDLKGNTHPTVKPTDLMAYLCRLVTPPGGKVLDLFFGSGSTGKACVREGFEFVGIDKDEDEHGKPAGYLEIAVARITHEIAEVARQADSAAQQVQAAARQKTIFELDGL